MRASQLFLPTLREDPADAEAASHKLLVRGGFIRQVSAGIWTFLPLGWRVHQKIDQIIREEMNAIGGQEMLCPCSRPPSSGRRPGAITIPEIFHLQDRAGRRFVLPLSHEETMTFHARELQLVQGAAAALVPLRDEGPRRAASAGRPAARCASSS